MNGADVHIWRVDATITPAWEEFSRHVLSADETARANRFLHRADRDRYLVAHCALRLILARYLTIAPSELTWVTNQYGKPRLVDPVPLHFNMSHSGNIVLIAVSARGEVGVDVEQHRAGVQCLEIAERFFAPPEIDALRNLDANSVVRGFFDCWVRKEAYIKAIGQGLSYSLDRFSVPLCPQIEGSVVLHDVAHGKWQLRGLSVEKGYSAAVVAGGGVANAVMNYWGREDEIFCRDSYMLNG